METTVLLDISIKGLIGGPFLVRSKRLVKVRSWCYSHHFHRKCRRNIFFIKNVPLGTLGTKESRIEKDVCSHWKSNFADFQGKSLAEQHSVDCQIQCSHSLATVLIN